MSVNDESDFVPLFNGTDLGGWHSIPRVYSPMWSGGPTIREAQVDAPIETRFTEEFLAGSFVNEARWSVEDGVIVGRQNEPGGGYGGFLITDTDYSDFELRLEAKPDWPADSGILVRKLPETWTGIQILMDHRRSGSIGGFYGNGIGSFHAVSFNVDAEYDSSGTFVRLIEEDPATTIEPMGDKSSLLEFGASGEEFLGAWRSGDWNEFRILVQGSKPRITTWINDVKIAQIDLATLDFPSYDADAVAGQLGRAGRIALEVHDTDPMLGPARWGHDSAVRWRNIRVREMPLSD
jgi:hypothetical protein